MTERILVVDDEPANLRLYQAIIEKHFPGSEVRLEEGGVSGLSAVKVFRPSVVLLDARMPDMDGFEVCRHVKTDPATARTPVLMVSGAYIPPQHRLSGFEGGADAYVCKPFRLQELADQMKSLLAGGGIGRKAFRVMVVDGSRTSRQVILSEIKRNPYVEVVAFENGRAALAALAATDPDMVIVDVELDGMSGLELGERIKQSPGHVDTSVLLLSRNAADLEVQERARLIGCVEVLPKPFAPSSLLDYVGHMVSQRRGELTHGVLVADENPKMRHLIRGYLAGLRMDICEAGSTDEAEQMIRSKPIALIVLGAVIGGASGVEWCAGLRKRPEYRRLPVLGVSNTGSLVCAFIEAGADDCVLNEVKGDEFRVRVENLLKRQALVDELDTALECERALGEHKNRLLGIAAHDIRSPVTAIAHYAEMLLASPLKDGADVQAGLTVTRNSARHALELINSILDVRSIQSGVVEFLSEPFRFDDLLQERIAFTNEMGQKKGVTCKWHEKAPDMDWVWVLGDRRRLAQVVDNLLGNAVKYCPSGSTCCVSLTREVEGWLIEFEDNGPGIPRDELLGVFEEFGRTSVRPTGGEKSSGLGLAIVKRLVELHGGTVWMDSKVGKGTRVSVVLPACDPHAEESGGLSGGSERKAI